MTEQQVNNRVDVLQLLRYCTLKVIKEGEVIRTQESSIQDFIVVLKGKLELLYVKRLDAMGEITKNYEDFEQEVVILNQHEYLIPQKSKEYENDKHRLIQIKNTQNPAEVGIDGNEAEILILPYYKYQLVMKERLTKQHQIIDMLCEVLKGLENFTIQQKRKAQELFELEFFDQKDIIVKEGQEITHCYITYKGLIEITSQKNLYATFSQEEDKDYLTMCQFYKNKASGIGNASSSLMIQNLGQFTQGFWIGEEFHQIQHQNMKSFYQAQSLTDSIMFVIKIEHLDRLPIEILELIRKSTSKKLEQFQKRYQNLHKQTQVFISQQNKEVEGFQSQFNKTFDHISKIYPVATGNLKIKLRNEILLNSQMRPGVLLMKKNDRLEKSAKTEKNNKTIPSSYQLFAKRNQYKGDLKKYNAELLEKVFNRHKQPAGDHNFDEIREIKNQVKNQRVMTSHQPSRVNSSGVNSTMTWSQSPLYGKNQFRQFFAHQRTASETFSAKNTPIRLKNKKASLDYQFITQEEPLTFDDVNLQYQSNKQCLPHQTITDFNEVNANNTINNDISQYKDRGRQNMNTVQDLQSHTQTQILSQINSHNRTQVIMGPTRAIHTSYAMSKPLTGERNLRDMLNRTAINNTPFTNINMINNFTPNRSSSNRRKPDFMVGNKLYPDNLYQRDIVSIGTASTLKSYSTKQKKMGFNIKIKTIKQRFSSLVVE
ncbi:UNKNOWN [Stylonychia lemnae]|uniref:Cyclic nucleotide-binding domain-containing protein n=1 Tax=Stylonychia lemnae TaxID=5949 RepID=A0A078AM45_STYLE|nr:UNKNOWN [Stylonychia lemnae]|eukprot:CDW83294.1 UNKNOWN [Stylonychia lemnae]